MCYTRYDIHRDGEGNEGEAKEGGKRKNKSKKLRKREIDNYFLGLMINLNPVYPCLISGISILCLCGTKYKVFPF